MTAIRSTARITTVVARLTPRWIPTGRAMKHSLTLMPATAPFCLITSISNKQCGLTHPVRNSPYVLLPPPCVTFRRPLMASPCTRSHPKELRISSLTNGSKNGRNWLVLTTVNGNTSPIQPPLTLSTFMLCKVLDLLPFRLSSKDVGVFVTVISKPVISSAV